MKILIIVPAYNEEESILKVCEQLKTRKDLDILVINDCSTDNTLKILQENKINHINLPYNLGIGGALQTGYQYALEHDYDIAIQFDGDGQHDVNYIDTICKPIIEKKANFVIGSRYLDKSTSEFKSTNMRRLGNKIIALAIKSIHKVNITDTTSGFRAADKETIKVFCNHYAFKYSESTCLVKVIKNKLKIQEESVNMKCRNGGKSTIRNFSSIIYMIQALINIIIS